MKLKLHILFYYLSFSIHNWLLRTGILKLEALQKKRFKKLRRHLQQSPFYKANVSAQSPLEAFPLIGKEVFMKEFDSINTVGVSKETALAFAREAESTRDFSTNLGDITVGLSSGTSGNVGIFMANTRERAIWVAAVLDRVIGFSLKKRKIAFFLRANSKLYSAIRSPILSFHFFDILTPFEGHIEALGQLQPHILVAQPSVLRTIAQAVVDKKIQLNPDKVISVAEVLEPQDRRYFQSVFNRPIDEVYQCTEGFLAASCKAGNLHMNEDFIILEKKYLDDTHTRFHPVITDLFRYTQPVVRYELNDILVEKKGACSCGKQTFVIGKIEGRSDDVLIFPNQTGDLIKVYPDTVRRAILRASEHIQFYIVTQIGKAHLECYLEVSSDRDYLDTYQQVRESVKESLAKLEIKHVEISFIESFQQPLGDKLRRVRNNYFSAEDIASKT